MGLQFWKKRKRGTYRSAKQRAQEEQAAVDLLMLQAWKDDLREHPEYLRQVTRQKFGMSDIGEGEVGYEQPDFLSKIHEVVDAKEGFDSLFGGSKPGATAGFMGMLSDIVKQDKKGDIAKAIAGLINTITGKAGQPGQPQIAQQPQPQRIVQREPEQIAEPEPKSPQEAMTLFANRFMELESEQAALELFQHQDEIGDVRQVIWGYLSESSMEDVQLLIPQLIEHPNYAFLAPFAQKLETNKGKRWLALVIDECHRLSSGEIEIKEVDNDELGKNQ